MCTSLSNFMFVLIAIPDVANLGFSYNLGPGSYATLHFPQPGQSLPVISQQLSPTTPSPIPPSAPSSPSLPSAPVSPINVQTAFLQQNALTSVNPVPIFLNTPVPNQVQSPVVNAHIHLGHHPAHHPVDSPPIQPHHPPHSGHLPPSDQPLAQQSFLPVDPQPIQPLHPAPLSAQSSRPFMLPVQAPPLPMKAPISLPNYQLSQPGPVNSFVSFGATAPHTGHDYQTNFIVNHSPVDPPQSVYVPSTPPPFLPSRPDLVPPHLHPAHHPLPPHPHPAHQPLPPEHLPVYTQSTPPPAQPTNQYDPFEFSKTVDEENSPPPPSISSPPPFIPASPVVIVDQPIPPPLFPSLTPLPAVPSLPFPQYDDQPVLFDFPEYDAVPVNVPFSRLLTLQPSSPAKQARKYSNKLDKSSSDFLSTTSHDIDLQIADRLKRKDVKKSKKINNSHGGPSNMLDLANLCGKVVDKDDINLLNNKFVSCQQFLTPCGLSHDNKTAVTQYGMCLNKK